MLRNLNPNFVIPETTTLWRYMNLSQFLWMLNERALYFATLAEFDDSWEGVLPSRSIERARERGAARAIELRIPEKAAAGGNLWAWSMANKVHKQGEAHRYLCWHENKSESVAMWKLYTRGRDGVAIQTTIARIESCLSELPYAGVGRVDYSGHDLDEEETSSRSTRFHLLKRRGFAHEREIRVFMRDYDRPDLAEYWDGEVSEKKEGPRGGIVRIDIDHLIERVVASPEYLAWAISSLQSIVSAAGLAVKVETSALLKPPPR